MIESLLGLSDKVAKLLEHREKRALFKYQTVVAPMHTSLMVVHGDYLRMLEACVKGLRENIGVTEIADQLEVDRVNHEPLRRDVLARLDAFQEGSTDEHYCTYFFAVGRYLAPWHTTSNIQNISKKTGIALSTSRTLLLLFRETKANSSAASRNLTRALVEAQLERMRSRWDSVVIAQARLQAKLAD